MGAPERVIFEPTWIHSVKAYVQPYWDGLVDGPLVHRASTGQLSLAEMRGWMCRCIRSFTRFQSFWPKR